MILQWFFIIFLALIEQRNCLINTEKTLLNIPELVNNANITWQATDKFVREVSEKNLRLRLGTKKRSNSDRLRTLLKPLLKFGLYTASGRLPKSFDARINWPKCPSISQIRDQGNCGNCWAVAAASAFSDRLCIAKKNSFTKQLSAQQLTFCCENCGEQCNGGYMEDAWLHLKENGIVTGAGYKSNEGCQPYEIPPLNLSYSWYNFFNNQHLTGGRSCTRGRCTNTKYSTPFNQDFHYAKNVYILPKHETAIRKEILTNGPVEASFDVYRDFYYYSKGIYKHLRNAKYEGGHAVKIIGWGEEKGVKYWICSNSWGPNWGENGTFRILRGSNECWIEEHILAGLAKS